MIKCGWRCIAIGSLCIIVIVGIWFYICGSHTTVLLVRHADRDPGSTVDAVNPDGQTRSGELAHVLDKAGLDAIIRSDANRAVQTAAPTATAEGLTPISLTGSDVAAFVNEIRTNHRGQTVLVVGHSNTVPDIIAQLGGPAVTMGENEYDNLYVLTLCRCRWGTAKLVNLQYGASTQ